MSGLFLNSGVLFRTAEVAFERSNDSSQDERGSKTNDALVAVIFAAASAEAFINEIGGLASHPEIPGFPHPPQVPACARLLKEAESNRGNTLLKYHLAKVAFTGEAYDKGAQPFQDFDLLMDLRNSLVHLKFDKIVHADEGGIQVQHPPVIKKLTLKKILASFNGGCHASWVMFIRTPAVAKWACNACSAMVMSIVDCIPESHLRMQAGQM